MQNLCDPNFLLFDLRYIFNNSEIIHSNYPLELINNDGSIIKVDDFEACLNYAKIGYKYKSIYINRIKIPWINLSYLIITIFSFFQNK